jgi:SAM-dependent methyltransferase
MSFTNAYGDATRAEAYARLEFSGTYYLAFRDVPELVSRHVRTGGAALDFGCGTGRSTRYVRGLGLSVTGVDISAAMLRLARQTDPSGDYRLVPDGDVAAPIGGPPFAPRSFDLVFSAFTFDNVAPRATKARLFAQFRELLAPGGCVVSIVSTPDIYTHEWVSFSTRDFPDNWLARPGDIVRTIITDVVDRRPVDDVLWPDAQYREVYEEAGLEVVESCLPIATGDEPYAWVSETRVAPWCIYVLGQKAACPSRRERFESGHPMSSGQRAGFGPTPDVHMHEGVCLDVRPPGRLAGPAGRRPVGLTDVVGRRMLDGVLRPDAPVTCKVRLAGRSSGLASRFGAGDEPWATGSVRLAWRRGIDVPGQKTSLPEPR